MVVEHYITELLYRYDCVVVPNFGAFLAHQVSAHIDSRSQRFYAPSKAMAFNAQLKVNDGLLISHIAQAEKSSYERVLKVVEDRITAWSHQLQSGGKLHLEGLGSLWHSADGKIQYEPQEDTNYLMDAFGMEAIPAVPITRETLKEAVLQMEEEVPFIISTDKRSNTGLRPYFKYAAVGLLLLATGLTAYRINENRLEHQNYVDQQVREQVNKEIQEATFFDTRPLPLPSIHLNKDAASKTTAAKPANHHIIAGAFRVKANADRKIKALKRKGFDAAYYGTNAYGLHMVSYARFGDAQTALQQLRTIKKEHSSDAWLLSVK